MIKLAPNELEQVLNRLNHGVECEIKYANDKLIVNKTKRQLLFKGVDISNDQIKAILAETPNSKIEFKLEQGKLVVVLVSRKQLI